MLRHPHIVEFKEVQIYAPVAANTIDAALHHAREGFSTFKRADSLFSGAVEGWAVALS